MAITCMIKGHLQYEHLKLGLGFLEWQEVMCCPSPDPGRAWQEGWAQTGTQEQTATHPRDCRGYK